MRSKSQPPHAVTVKHRRSRVALLVPVVPLALIGAAWYFGDLSLLKSPERIAAAVQSVSDSPLGLVYVLTGFSIGTLLFVPITGLMVGTIMAFGTVRGFAFAALGTQAAAVVTYWAGRLSGSHALEYASGPRLALVRKALRNHAFRASILARILPLGNFTVINLLAGSMRVPFRAFFFGSLIGMLPGLLILTLFADQIASVVRNPSKQNLTFAAIGATVLLGLGLWLRRYLRRSEPKRPAPLDGGVEAHEGARP